MKNILLIALILQFNAYSQDDIYDAPYTPPPVVKRPKKNNISQNKKSNSFKIDNNNDDDFVEVEDFDRYSTNNINQMNRMRRMYGLGMYSQPMINMSFGNNWMMSSWGYNPYNNFFGFNPYFNYNPYAGFFGFNPNPWNMWGYDPFFDFCISPFSYNPFFMPRNRYYNPWYYNRGFNENRGRYNNRQPRQQRNTLPSRPRRSRGFGRYDNSQGRSSTINNGSRRSNSNVTTPSNGAGKIIRGSKNRTSSPSIFTPPSKSNGGISAPSGGNGSKGSRRIRRF